MGAIGLALPPKRITVNLAIAVGLLIDMGVLGREEIGRYSVLGELALGEAVASVARKLPAAVDAVARGRGLICPAAQTAVARVAINLVRCSARSAGNR